MSGLLVKSHADHAGEPRGAERPRPRPASRCCSAAPPSPARYVERDLRGVYEGRLFYGKDAFEGLRMMDRLGAMKRGDAPDDPDWGREPSASRRAGAVPADGDDAEVELPAAVARGRRPTTPVFVPPFLGSKVVKGIAVDEIAALPQRDGAVPQPVGLPARQATGEDDAAFKERIRPVLRERAGQGHGRRASSCRRSCTATSRPTATATTLVIWTDETRTAELHPVPRSRASARRRSSASPTSSGRSTSAEVDYAAFHIVTMGAGGVRGRRPSCSPTTATTSTSTSTASASRWPRRWPSCGTAASARSGASPTRTGRRSPACSASSTGAAATRGATRRAPTSRTTPRVAELLDAGRIGVEVQRGDRLPVPARSRRPRRSSATTPRPSTSSPGEPAVRRAAGPRGSRLLAVPPFTALGIVWPAMAPWTRAEAAGTAETVPDDARPFRLVSSNALGTTSTLPATPLPSPASTLTSWSSSRRRT